MNTIRKPVIFCGVQNSDGTLVYMTQEEKEKFTKMCSHDGLYNAIFCEDISILKNDSRNHQIKKNIT